MAGSFTDFLFQGQPPASVTTYGTSTANIPQYLSDYTLGLLNQSNAVAAEPYQQYQGPRVASLTPDTQSSFNTVRNAQGSWMPSWNVGQNDINTASNINPMQAASGNLQAATGRANDPGTMSSYMNPYIQNVNDALAEQAGRNFQQTTLPTIMDQFTRAGTYGSQGQQAQVGIALGNMNKDLEAQQSANLSNGFNQANSAFQSDQSRLANIGQVQGNLASATMQNLGNLGYNSGIMGQLNQAGQYKDSAALDQIGQEQQNNTQQNLNTAYSDFQAQVQYPKDQLNFMSSMVRGLPYSQSTTSTNTAPGTAFNPSGLAQLGTLATGLQSLGNMTSSDARVKENIKKVGNLHDGQNVYRYNYKGDKRTHIGLIAQEVAKHRPEAVGVMPAGHLGVDYDLATRFAKAA